jgi:hypothetical protein
MAEAYPKFRVYVRAMHHRAYFEAMAEVPREVREHIQFIYLGDPSRIRHVKHPMVWRAEGWAEHLHADALNAAEEAAMSTRWSWPPAEVKP